MPARSAARPTYPDEPRRWSWRLGGRPAILAEQQAARSDKQMKPGGRHLYLLVVDDEPPIRMLARLALSASGHQVEEAPDGASALRMVEDRPFDAVIMDIHMPVMDGLEAARRIRALPGPGRHVPILGVSAMAPEEECLAAGMSAFMRKPTHARDLLRAVERLTDSEASV